MHRGTALSEAPYSIKNNKSLVLLAIKKSSIAIKFASKKLKDDDEVANALIESYKHNYHFSPRSFTYLSERIKSDRAFIENAFNLNLGIYRYLNKEYIENSDYYLKVFQADNWATLTTPMPGDNLDKSMFLKMDLSSLSLVRRLKIAANIFDSLPNRLNKTSNIFSMAMVLKCLNLKQWEINHIDEVIFWKDFPSKRKEIFNKCKRLGKVCFSCHPPT